MERKDIIDRVAPIAQKIFENQNLIISDDLSPLTLPTWTSLTFTQFLKAVESEFAVKFSLIELLRFKNMGAILDSLEKHLS